MKALIFPPLFLLLGLGGGAAAAMYLAPADPAEPEPACVDPALAGGDHLAPPASASHDAPAGSHEYAKLGNQFVVPVVEDGSVTALVILSLSVEVPAGRQDEVYLVEPKLRDAFLQVLFDHANTGGFAGLFTAPDVMRDLRDALSIAATQVAGDLVSDVLIVDLVRQDV